MNCGAQACQLASGCTARAAAAATEPKFVLRAIFLGNPLDIQHGS